MRKIFTILLLSAASLTAFSQEKGSFELGFNVGYNASTVQSGSMANTSFRSGFNIGASGDYFFSDRWSLKAKLSFDQKGWDDGYFINLSNGSTYQTDFNYDYLTIPIMANWHFGKKRNWYLNAGPYAGVLLNAKATAIDLDVKDYSNSIDVGLDLGIGVKIPVAKRVKILLELDGQVGFTDVIKGNQGSALRNNRSSVNAGVAFGL